MSDYFQVGGIRGERWHDKGFWIQDETAFEVGQITGLNDIKFVLSPSYAHHEGKFYEIPGKSQLGIVGAPWAKAEFLPLGRQVDRYEPLQHEFMAQVMDALIKTSGGKFALESFAIVGKDGEISFIEVKTPDFYIGGVERERHERYLLLADNKRNRATVFSGTSVRVVCWNTVTFAMSNMPTIPHHTDVTAEVKFVSDLYAATLRAQGQEEAFLNRLFKTKVTKEQVANGFENVFPTPAPTRAMRQLEQVNDLGLVETDFPDKVAQVEKDIPQWQRGIDLAVKRREQAMENFVQFNDENSYAADTAYAFFQAGTQLLTHQTFTGDPVKQRISEIFGQKATFAQNLYKVAEAML